MIAYGKYGSTVSNGSVSLTVGTILNTHFSGTKANSNVSYTKEQEVAGSIL